MRRPADPLQAGSGVRSRRRRAAAGLGLVLLLWGPGRPGSVPEAAATSLVRLDLAGMTARASVIVHATVEDMRSRYLSGEGPGGTIVTDVRLRVRRGLLGAHDGEILTLQHLGGVVGEIGQLVPGEARFRVGEEVVVLLAPRPGGLFTVGMTQGALHVRRDDKGEARVQVDLAGAELLPSPNPSAAPSPEAPPATRDPSAGGMPLALLLQRLEALIASGRSTDRGR